MKHMGRAFSSEERRGAVAEMDGMKRTKSGSSSNIAGKGNESVSVEKESDLRDGIRIDLESQPVVGGEAGVRDQDDNRDIAFPSCYFYANRATLPVCLCKHYFFDTWIKDLSRY